MTYEIVPMPDGRKDPWWRRWSVTVREDWTGVLMPWKHNWSDFTLIEVSGEVEQCFGTAELNVALLGLHLRLACWWPNARREQLHEEVEAMLREKDNDI